MARGRMIDKSIRKSKKFRDLKTDKSRLLYLMMYPHVDSSGKFTADPEEIKIECVPLLGYTIDQIAESIIEMHIVGLINIGIDDDEPYLEISRFKDFNKIREDREGASKYPEICGSSPGVVQEYASLIKYNIIQSNELINERIKKNTIYFDFKTGEFINISENDKSVWAKAYPACDINLALFQMAAWLIANPKNQKSNYKRFISNWLSRTQDKGGTKGTLINKQKDEKDGKTSKYAHLGEEV